jgi:uncharacterized protein (TIGR02001 family)
MRNYNKTIGALAAVTAFTAGVAQAEIEGDVYAGYSTDYIFRGVNLAEDLAEAGVNLSTTCPLTQGTISLGLWYGSGNDQNGTFDNQMNTSIGLTKEVGNFDLSIGYINYDHNGAVQIDTQEIYVGASTEVFAGVNFGLTAFFDVDANDSLYVEAAASKSFEVNSTVNLNLSAGVGFYDGDDNISDGFNHWFLGASLPWAARENLTVTPFVKYVQTDSDYNAGISTDGDEVIGGVRLSVGF